MKLKRSTAYFFGNPGDLFFYLVGCDDVDDHAEWWLIDLANEISVIMLKWTDNWELKKVWCSWLLRQFWLLRSRPNKYWIIDIGLMMLWEVIYSLGGWGLIVSRVCGGWWMKEWSIGITAPLIQASSVISLSLYLLHDYHSLSHWKCEKLGKYFQVLFLVSISLILSYNYILFPVVFPFNILRNN